MKIEKHDGSDEKTVLIGMIVDDMVCGRIVGKWSQGKSRLLGESESGLFRSKWSNLVGSWCVKHFERFGHAPGRKIQHLFERWAEKGSRDEATVNLVERFLSGLSEEWVSLKRESNSEYVLDVAGKHFALVQAERFKEQLDDLIQEKEPDKIASAINGYTQVKLGLGEGIDVFHDKEAWKSAYGPHTEPLIEFSGALGRFFGNALARHSFVAFEGPEGRGKSFWLQEIAFRAVLQRRRVAFFELGDMTRDQIMERMGCRFAVMPLQPCKVKYPKKMIPPKKEEGKEPPAQVVFETRRFEEGMTWQKALRACEDICRKQIKSDEPYWMLYNYAPDVLHCRDIQTILTEQERNGWVADCVVIDYADNLSMTYAGKEGRDCINETWKHMRRISMEHHCLLVTATQTNAASNEAHVIRRKHFSDDKRKRATPTAVYGINQTETEKDSGIMRLNNLKKRRGAYKESFCVHVAGCLELANPAVLSTF